MMTTLNQCSEKKKEKKKNWQNKLRAYLDPGVKKFQSQFEMYLSMKLLN